MTFYRISTSRTFNSALQGTSFIHLELIIKRLLYGKALVAQRGKD